MEHGTFRQVKWVSFSASRITVMTKCFNYLLAEERIKLACDVSGESAVVVSVLDGIIVEIFVGYWGWGMARV